VRPETRRRICLAVFYGLIAMVAVALAVIFIFPVGWPKTPSLVIGLTIFSLSLWFLMAPLALGATRACRELRVPDVVVGTVLLFLLMQTVVMFAKIGGRTSRLVDGEPCNGGAGRKMISSSPSSTPNSPVCWACLPFADYEAKRATQPASSSSGHKSGLPGNEVFNRLLRNHFASRSLVFGAVTALTAWLYAFGWRWRVRTDEL
jgi:hypothetical protein